MPDASGRIRGTGWSRRAEAAFDRLRSNAVSPPLEMLTTDDVRRRYDEVLVRNGLPPIYEPGSHARAAASVLRVPSEPPPEVETWLADRSDAEDNWPADAYDQRRSAWRTCD